MIRLFLSYIIHCKLKFPLTAFSYDDHNYYKKNEPFSNIPQIIYTDNNRECLAIIKNTKYTIYDRCNYIYKWTFLGYKDSILIKDCKWGDFKRIYTSLFYPHLISEEELVINCLSETTKKDIARCLLLKKFKF